MIAAILRAHLLSMRIGRSRGAALSIAAGAIWYGMWCVAAVATYAGASAAKPDQLQQFLPAAFLAIFIYWQFVPVLSASVGSGLDLRKLLVYPLPHHKLFVVEILLRLTSGFEMVMVLAAGTAGLLANKGVAAAQAAPGLLAAVLVFILFNLLLASGVRSILDRLMSNRKFRELIGFVVLSLYVIPRLLAYSGVSPGAMKSMLSAIGAAAFPWTAAARGAMPLGPGEPRWLALVSLCGWTAAAAWFGRAQFERNLRYDALAAQATPLRNEAPRAQSLRERLYRLPALFWRDPVAAVIEKELRTLARAPRFRMVFIMGFTFGLAVWFPALASGHDRMVQLPSYFLILVCVYALTLLGQVSYWNCFGFDRSAAAVYFIAPQPILKTLIGKNVASLVFVYLEVVIISGITLALRLTTSWAKVSETLIVVAVCSLYLLGLGNVSSVHYPHGMRAERVSRGGSGSRFQGLVFLIYPVALLPVFLAYIARWALASQLAFVLVLAIAAIIGGVFYWIATESAVHAAGHRREQILQELSKGEGPVASD